MPDEDVKKFLVFQEHYDVFSLLLDRGVFNIRNGSAALHFDANGILQAVQRADYIYSRKHEDFIAH